MESTRMTSGDLSQLIAVLWSASEQIRDPQYRNHVKGLRDVPASQSSQEACQRALICAGHCYVAFWLQFFSSTVVRPTEAA
jgi:hypothetical protein